MAELFSLIGLDDITPSIYREEAMSVAATPIERLEAQVRARRTLPSPASRRALREAAGVSLGDVAQACGVTKQAVRQWESGICDPRGANLIAYAEVLRVLRFDEEAERP